MVKRLTNPLQERPVPLGSLLSAAGQHLVTELDRALSAAGLTGVRSAQGRLFLTVDPEGTRQSVLAERAGMTKQAMGEQVRRLQKLGYVELLPDPDDRRAQLVRLTDRGWQGVEVAEKVITEFDRWLDGQIGRRRVEGLRETLRAILVSTPSDWASGANQ